MLDQLLLTEWLQQRGLLKQVCLCDRRNCRRRMALSPRDGKDGYRWRCPARQCRSSKSIRHGSFFAKSKLPLKVFLALIYCWAVGMRLTTVTIVIGLSQPTVVDWYNYMREECTHKLLNMQFLFGSVGNIVEIDESLMVKQKYQHGRRREQH
eukprot:gene6331-7057_t